MKTAYLVCFQVLGELEPWKSNSHSVTNIISPILKTFWTHPWVSIQTVDIRCRQGVSVEKSINQSNCSFINLSVSMCDYVCTCLYVNVGVSVCVYIYIRKIGVNIYIYIYIYIYISVCVCVCVCVRAHELACAFVLACVYVCECECMYSFIK